MDNHINLSTRKVFTPILTGVITAIVSSIILLVFFSVFMLMQNMPSSSGYFLSFIIVCIAALLGGFVTGRGVCAKGLVFGAVTGFLYVFIISLIGLVAGFAVNYFGTFLLKAIFATAFGGIGGILAMNIRKR